MLFDKKNFTKTRLGLIFIFSFAAFFPQAAGARIDDCSTAVFSDGLPSETLVFPTGGGTNTEAKVKLPIGSTITSAAVDLSPENITGTPFIWIPNSGSGTLAQIRTSNGALVKLYQNDVGGFPANAFSTEKSGISRITVIPGGDVYVANRGNQYITRLKPKPAPSEEYDYGGKLDMGTLISGAGVYQIRAVTFDKNGYVWGGTCMDSNHSEDRVKVFCGANKTNPNCTDYNVQLAELINGKCHYGAIGDKYGFVWTVGLGELRSYSYNSGAIAEIATTGSVPSSYGIGIDNDQNIWVGNWTTGATGAYKVNRGAAGNITGVNSYTSGLTANTGIAADGLGNVWVAGFNTNKVSRFRTDGAFVDNYDAGSYPHGVAIDFDNNAWVVNKDGGAPPGKTVLNPSSCTAGGGSVTKYKSDGTYIGTYATCGNGPYNYSDMTGFRSIPATFTLSSFSTAVSMSGKTPVSGWGTDLQAVLAACSSPGVVSGTDCEVPLSIFSATGGTYEAKNLNIVCTTAVAPVLGGLVPCGRLDNNSATSWDDTAPCNLCFGFLMLQNIVNWLTQIAVGIAVFILVIAGLFYVFSSGDPGKIELAKSVISYALTGLALVFIAWLLTGVIIAALGYSHPFTGGGWNIVDCPIS